MANAMYAVLTQMQRHMGTLSQRVTDLSARMDAAAAEHTPRAPAPTPAPAPPPPVQDDARFQQLATQVALLKQSIEALRKEMKKELLLLETTLKQKVETMVVRQVKERVQEAVQTATATVEDEAPAPDAAAAAAAPMPSTLDLDLDLNALVAPPADEDADADVELIAANRRKSSKKR